jgi:hypothetical protein
MKTPMLSEHFHPIVGMAHSRPGGSYAAQNVIVDSDETHFTKVWVELDADIYGKVRRFVTVRGVKRLPLSGPIVEVDGWCSALVARGISDWFGEKGIPLPRAFDDYVRGVENIERLAKEDE